MDLPQFFFPNPYKAVQQLLGLYLAWEFQVCSFVSSIIVQPPVSYAKAFYDVKLVCKLLHTIVHCILCFDNN